jgi:hypothetical protein
VTVSAKPGVVPIDLPTARRIARDAVADLSVAANALRRRDANRAAGGAGGAWLAQLRGRIRAAAGGSFVVPAYRVERAHISLEPGVGQGPPRVVSVLEGTVERSSYSRGSLASRATPTPFKQTYELALEGSRFVIVAARGRSAALPTGPAGRSPRSRRRLEGHCGVRGRQADRCRSEGRLHFRQARSASACPTRRR